MYNKTSLGTKKGHFEILLYKKIEKYKGIELSKVKKSLQEIHNAFSVTMILIFIYGKTSVSRL